MPSRFYESTDSGVNEKQTVFFDNKRSKYNFLCLYIEMYHDL